jgi:hypothetical protein
MWIRCGKYGETGFGVSKREVRGKGVRDKEVRESGKGVRDKECIPATLKTLHLKTFTPKSLTS